MHACTPTHMNACTHARTHTCTHTHTHAHTHTHTYTHTKHIHTLPMIFPVYNCLAAVLPTARKSSGSTSSPLSTLTSTKLVDTIGIPYFCAIRLFYESALFSALLTTKFVVWTTAKKYAVHNYYWYMYAYTWSIRSLIGIGLGNNRETVIILLSWPNNNRTMKTFNTVNLILPFSTVAIIRSIGAKYSNLLLKHNLSCSLFTTHLT